MHLCDFGSFMSRCPESDDCTGPGGTKYEPSRLYSWNQWIARRFTKDSLLELFPGMRSEIDEKVDPGEYGVEDYWCRLGCCFIFFLFMMEELLLLARTSKLLYSVPTKAESWINFVAPIPAEDEVELDKETAYSSTTLKVAGIPGHWKFFIVLVVLIPKALIFPSKNLL